ncbi:MAG TPA: L,D-transpeptidase [Candidatus Magasanikbacteria bacterium]|nr:L,D-transpeptidase [Candidatus Magasanikbacteria bacterium]
MFRILIISLLFLFPLPLFAADVLDTDMDGLSDELELQLGTDIQNKDSDNDGYDDGLEVENGYNPLKGEADKSLPRHVEVDKNTQQLKWFLNNVQVGKAPVSTGVVGMDTPNGEFKILRKRPTVNYQGRTYNYPNTKWNLEFKKSFYLHGAYWHNQFGIKPMSHGCVNIAYENAEKIYKFLSVGDRVVISGNTPKGKVILAGNKP